MSCQKFYLKWWRQPDDQRNFRNLSESSEKNIPSWKRLIYLNCWNDNLRLYALFNCYPIPRPWLYYFPSIFSVYFILFDDSPCFLPNRSIITLSGCPFLSSLFYLSYPSSLSVSLSVSVSLSLSLLNFLNNFTLHCLRPFNWLTWLHVCTMLTIWALLLCGNFHYSYLPDEGKL